MTVYEVALKGADLPLANRCGFSHDARAHRAYRLGRWRLRAIATIVTPDTLLRWHRQLIARKWTYASRWRRRGVLAQPRADRAGTSSSGVQRDRSAGH